jgi:hypothetical protein
MAGVSNVVADLETAPWLVRIRLATFDLVGVSCGSQRLPRGCSLLPAGSVVTEDPRKSEGLVPRLLPQLLAAWGAACDLDVPAAGCLGSWTVAGLPADGYCARPPRVAAATLVCIRKLGC